MAIFTFQKLYRAYLDCRENKRKTVNAIKFEIDLENNLSALLRELKGGEYKPGRSICFVVTEPKPREIFAADFRDRVVHHLLVREIEDHFERRFIYDSYACRAGKGTHRAAARLSGWIGRRENRDLWYLKMDISSFFMSIDKNILYGLARAGLNGRSRAEKRELDWLLGTVIFHNPAEDYTIKGDPGLFSLIPPEKSLLGRKGGKGLPIGNYSSQFFANVYMNRLDQFAKRELNCRYYIRYVDDFLLLSNDRRELRRWRNWATEFVWQNLRLNIAEKKTMTQPVLRGIDFLGYYLKPGSIHPRRSVAGRYKDKLFRIAIGERKSELSYLLAMRNSYQGHFEFSGRLA